MDCYRICSFLRLLDGREWLFCLPHRVVSVEHFSGNLYPATAILRRMQTSTKTIIKRLALELTFVLPIALLIAYLPDADSVDRWFFYFYLVVSISIRMLHRKPLDEWGWLVFHNSVVVVLMHELNKLEGYPDRQDPTELILFSIMLLFPCAVASVLHGIGLQALAIFVALVFGVPFAFLAANILSWPFGSIITGLLLFVAVFRWVKASRPNHNYVISGLLAAAILHLSIVESAMQASRQLWFQTLPSYRPCVYATKISDLIVYGVDLREKFNVVWFSRESSPNSSIGNSNNVKGLGGGTMEAQTPNISPLVWKWKKLRSCPNE